MRLYYHKTDGGAEYLTDKYVLCPTGHKEGIFEGAKYIVRIDGNIEKDAELLVRWKINFSTVIKKVGNFLKLSAYKGYETNHK